jgi:hypothetical protein
MAQPLISSLEKLIGTPRDGALLRYSLGVEYLKAGEKRAQSSSCARPCSATRTILRRGSCSEERSPKPMKPAQALEAWTRGIEAARRKGDRQAEKEMNVFARRVARNAAK